MSGTLFHFPVVMEHEPYLKSGFGRLPGHRSLPSLPLIECILLKLGLNNFQPHLINKSSLHHATEFGCQEQQFVYGTNLPTRISPSHITHTMRGTLDYTRPHFHAANDEFPGRCMVGIILPL